MLAPNGSVSLIYIINSYEGLSLPSHTEYAYLSNKRKSLSVLSLTEYLIWHTVQVQWY